MSWKNPVFKIIGPKDRNLTENQSRSTEIFLCFLWLKITQIAKINNNYWPFLPLVTLGLSHFGPKMTENVFFYDYKVNYIPFRQFGPILPLMGMLKTCPICPKMRFLGHNFAKSGLIWLKRLELFLLWIKVNHIPFWHFEPILLPGHAQNMPNFPRKCFLRP